MQQCNALPLAAQLWKGADAQLRRSLMTAVSAVASAGKQAHFPDRFCPNSVSSKHSHCQMRAALWRRPAAAWDVTARLCNSHAGEECMPEGQRDAWTERLLQLVLQDDTPAPLRAAAGVTLGGAHLENDLQTLAATQCFSFLCTVALMLLMFRSPYQYSQMLQAC